MIANGRFAIVTVPDRAGPVFAATVSSAVPLPLIDVALAMDTQAALFVIVHVQPVPACTATDVGPPAAGTVAAADASANVQPAA